MNEQKPTQTSSPNHQIDKNNLRGKVKLTLKEINEKFDRIDDEKFATT